MKINLHHLLISGATCAFLSACGGGGSSSSVPTTTAPPVSTSPDPVFESGTFAASSTFKSQCETIRPGRSDRAGSTLIEKFWIRSWNDETYLWYNEVTDRDPNSIADRIDYFDELRTRRTTASGKPVDEFHFNVNTEDFEANRDGEASAGYGASFRFVGDGEDRGRPPRDIRVAFTQTNVPAGAFRRGDRILIVDGVDAVNGGATQADLDILNEGIFPRTAGVEHNFTVRGDDGVERDITVTATDVVEQPVTATSIIDTDDGKKVGYIHFTTFSPFSSEEAIYTAMREMDAANVDDLVLDLRYNGGGLLAVAAQVGYMVAGDTASSGRTFDGLIFNDKTPPRTPQEFISTGVGFSLSEGTPLPELSLNRVFILSTSGTCSASEAVINGLRGIDVEVILIGSQTCGKPYGFLPEENCGETYFTVQFRGSNDKGFGDYADGFLPNDGAAGFGEEVPGCTIADDFVGVLGDADEPFLAAALQFAADGTCPVIDEAAVAQRAQSKAKLSFSTGLDMMSDPRIAYDEFIRTSRIRGVTDDVTKE